MANEIGQQRPMPFSNSNLPTTGPRPGSREIVAMLAGLMALNAFAIDAMIPALPAIGRALGVGSDNDRQLVVVAYMFGFGTTQLLWGPLADRFGRKPVLAVGILLYVLFAFLCAFAWTFPMLIGGRIAMGGSAAVTRVLVVTMVRDLFDGEEMARTMSLVFMVFMLVPVLAPSVGQGILLIGSWRVIFGILGAYGTLMALWSWRRLPETLHPDFRRTLQIGEIGGAMWATLSERQSLGYTVALTLTFGALTAYIASVQQIIFDAFKAPGAIGVAFAAIAAPMALTSWLNSRVVGTFGMRRVGHGGAIAFAAITVSHLLIAWTGHETLASFIVLQGLAMAAFAFVSSNFSTLAMEHMGEIAGTASSVQGVIGTIGGAAIGLGIGRAFDGTPLPFLMGMASCALLALLAVVITDPKRLLERI